MKKIKSNELKKYLKDNENYNTTFWYAGDSLWVPFNCLMNLQQIIGLMERSEHECVKYDGSKSLFFIDEKEICIWQVDLV